jgi:hypothetical protein
MALSLGLPVPGGPPWGGKHVDPERLEPLVITYNSLFKVHANADGCGRGLDLVRQMMSAARRTSPRT